MYLREAGKKENPAVVLIHGAPSNPDAFEGLVGKLSQTYRVLFPDLPGYGKSEPLKEPYSLAAVETQLAEELIRAGVKDCAVLGFSLGAVRALRLAIGLKVKVNRLVLVGGFAELSDAEREGMKGMAAMVRPLPDFTSAQLRTMFVQRMHSPAYLEANPAAASRTAAWLDATTPKVLADELDASAKLEDLTELLPMIRVPVTCIVGELDVATPPAHSELIARHARKGSTKVIPGSGHAVMYEQPEKFADAVLEGLARK